MEEAPSAEGLESRIWAAIKELARREGMSPDDIKSDIVTFAALLESDPDVRPYFEELAEKLGISQKDMMQYAKMVRNRSATT